VFAMLVGVITSSGFFVQKVKAAGAYTITFQPYDLSNSQQFTRQTDSNGKVINFPTKTWVYGNVPGMSTDPNYQFLGWVNAPVGGSSVTEDTIFTKNSFVYPVYGTPLADGQVRVIINWMCKNASPIELTADINGMDTKKEAFYTNSNGKIDIEYYTPPSYDIPHNFDNMYQISGGIVGAPQGFNDIYDGLWTAPNGGVRVDGNTVFTQETMIYAHYTGVTPTPLATATPTPTPLNTATPTPTPTQTTFSFTGTIEDIARQIENKYANDATFKNAIKPYTDGIGFYLKFATADEANYLVFDYVDSLDANGYSGGDDAILLDTGNHEGDPYTLIYKQLTYGQQYEMNMGIGYVMEGDDPNMTDDFANAPNIRILLNVTSPFVNFVDLNGHWAYDYAKWATDNDLIKGIDTTHFAPDNNLTRGMLATILYRYENPDYDTLNWISQSGAGTQLYNKSGNLVTVPDVTVGNYYNDGFIWCFNNGIIEGYEDGSFRPNQNITREELATIIDRYCTYKNKSLVNNGSNLANLFSDAKNISSWAYSAVGNLAANNIINGMGDGTFNPKGTATRAQVAKIIYMMAQKINK